jgi:hypothetical protein
LPWMWNNVIRSFVCKGDMTSFERERNGDGRVLFPSRSATSPRPAVPPRFEGRVAVVTGAARGMGRAIAVPPARGARRPAEDALSSCSATKRGSSAGIHSV